jgi:O-antigen/teichoic acid export membrane protein
MSRYGVRDGRRASYSEGAAYGSASYVLMGLLGVASAIAIARTYGIETVGAYALVMAPTNAVWYLSSARERAAFVREVASLEPRAPRITGLFWAMFCFSLGLTIVVAALIAIVTHILLTGPVDQPDLFLPALAYLATYVLLLNTAWNIDAVFLGFRAGRELFWIRLHLALVFLAVAVGLGLVVDSVWGLVLANLVSALTTFAHRLALIRPYMRAFTNRHVLREGFATLPALIKFGLKILPGSIANGITWEVPTWTIGLASPLASLGGFNRAQTLARRLNELDYRLTGMLLTTIIERNDRGDRAGSDRAFVDTVRYTACVLGLPAAVGAGAAGGIMALFGPGFSAAADALAVMLLMPALFSMAAVQSSALLALDRPLATSASALTGMVVTAIATVPLVMALGITGAAIGLVAGASVRLVLSSIVSFGDLSGRLGDLWSARQLAALLAAGGAGFAGARLVDSLLDGLAGVVPALAAGSASYVLVFVVAGGMNGRDRTRLRRLRAKISQRRSGPPAVIREAELPPA